MFILIVNKEDTEILMLCALADMDLETFEN